MSRVDVVPPCVGKHELFDSRNWADHREAAQICRTECSVQSWCRDIRRRCSDPRGTWGGRLAGGAVLSDVDERLDEVYDANEAHAAWAAYRDGDDGAWAREGYLVHIRRVPQARRVRASREPAPAVAS